jgi:hypothetical protein
MTPIEEFPHQEKYPIKDFIHDPDTGLPPLCTIEKPDFIPYELLLRHIDSYLALGLLRHKILQVTIFHIP